MKWKNKKVGLSLLASVILLSSLFGYQLGLSSVPASGPYYLDVPFGTASYYVGKFDNGSTYMVDCDTWRCTWWSTDSSAIVQASIGNITSGGSGRIFVRVGDYTLTNTISVTTLRGLVFEGEGSGMIGEVTRFIAPSGAPAFTLNGSAYGQALHVVMSQIEIKGDKSSGQIGIELDTVQSSTFRNIEFWNLDEAIRLHDASHFNTFDTLKVYNVATGIYDNLNNNQNVYRQITIGTVDDYGYYKPTGTGSSYINFDGFGVETAVNAYGIYIGTATLEVHIEHGYFVDVGSNASKAGVYLKGTSAVYPIEQSSIENSYFNRCGYGIRTDYVDGLVVQTNLVLSSTDSGATFSSNTKRLTKINNQFDSETDNSIEKLENTGTSSNSVNATWVTHGLAGTPDVVTLTISGSNYINSTCYLIAPTVIASNSTMFQIGFYIYNADTITAVTATDQRNIYWTAEYNP